MLLGPLVPTATQAQWGREVDASSLNSFQRASIVFATNDLSAPVSLFGHTFLVLHNEATPEPQSLVIEFGGLVNASTDYLLALVTDINGRYTASYYSYKEREYYVEGRSLWIYPLLLDPPSLLRLKLQVERSIGQVEPYTFGRWNCAHYVLALITSALNIPRQQPERPFVAPANTLRLLRQQGLLGAPVFSEAPGRRAQRAYRHLNEQQRVQFDLIQQDPDQPAATSIDPKVGDALSVAAEHWVMRESTRSRRDAWYRVKRRHPSGPPSEATPISPAANNGNGAWSLQQDLRRRDARIAWRYGFLTLDDEDQTDLRNASLEVLAIELALQSNHVRVPRADLVSMEANSSTDYFFEGFTQRLDLGYADDSILLGHTSRRASVRLGRGVTWQAQGGALSAIPFVIAGAFDDGSGFRARATAGLRSSAYIPLPYTWRAKASWEWYAASLASVRALQAIEVASPLLVGRHSANLRLEARNSRWSDAGIALRWIYRQ